MARGRHAKPKKSGYPAGVIIGGVLVVIAFVAVILGNHDDSPTNVRPALSPASPAESIPSLSSPAFSPGPTSGAILASPHITLTFITYNVKPGDSLSSIAKRFGVTPEELYSQNLLTVGRDWSKIYPGEIIELRIEKP